MDLTGDLAGAGMGSDPWTPLARYVCPCWLTRLMPLISVKCN